jgi:hypothetical protein
MRRTTRPVTRETHGAAQMGGWKNKLFLGDNLGILREHVADGVGDRLVIFDAQDGEGHL